MIWEAVEEISRRVANIGTSFINYVRIDRCENINDYLAMQDALSTKPEIKDKYVSFIIFQRL